MKKKLSILIIFFTLAFTFITNNVSVGAFADIENVYLGGMPAGFSMLTRGAYVVGTCDVVTGNGLVSPSKNADIRVGDVILSINDCEINNAKDIERVVKTENQSIVEILRDGQNIIKTVSPAKDMAGNYRLGVFIRDNVSGIGTITYIKGNKFASLGHPVINDNGEILPIISGELYNCNITGVIKGERGKAGELRGVFIRENPVATIEKNMITGVFGKLKNKIDYNQLNKIEIGDAEVGSATIFTTLDGNTPKEYSISIVKNDTFSENKNFVIKVTDKELLETTGGIIQGMSGSPIVQNGKLVGAVTHVFINDPTRGFGISIQNMLNS